MSPPCPVCRSAATGLAFVKEQIPHFVCRSCRFIFARPAVNPNLENRLEDYEAAYLQYLRPDPADEANFSELCSWMGRFVRLAGCALLDVGCGSGKLVYYLRRHGVEARGLEPAAALYEHFLAGGPFFVNGTLDSFQDDHGEGFDVLTALDVLEHVEQPAAFLQQIASLLPVGGLLFVSTPDAGSAAARLLGQRWHFYCPYHLSLFSRGNLKALAERLGLELLHCSRRGRYRSLGYTLQYLFEFLLRRRAPRFVRRLDRVSVPINLCDTMYLCLRKTRECGGHRVAAPDRRREVA